jgi:protein disulfide-isomerase
VEGQKWVPGDRRWGVIHQGRVYLFSGASEQARFYASPDTYAPAMSGNDVVLAAETGQMVPGQRQHGVFYGNRIYLFSSEQSLQKFERQPDRYVAAAPQGPRPASYAPPGR